MAVSKRHEAQTIQMAKTLQDVHNIVAAMMIPNHSNSHHPTMARTPVCRHSCRHPPRYYRANHQLGAAQSQMATSGLQRLLSTICSLLASAAMALLLMLPDIQSQLCTFMTLLKSPSLLLSNSIMVTDALNRTKLLPHEYFCNWNLVQPWLESAFEGLPGESRVRRGAFEMFMPMGNRMRHVLRGDDWKRSVFPGDRVFMSMRVITGMHRHKCIRCDRVTSYPVDAQEWEKW